MSDDVREEEVEAQGSFCSEPALNVAVTVLEVRLIIVLSLSLLLFIIVLFVGSASTPSLDAE